MNEGYKPIDAFRVKKRFMESVRDKRTREIVDTEDLWLLNRVGAEEKKCGISIKKW